MRSIDGLRWLASPSVLLCLGVVPYVAPPSLGAEMTGAAPSGSLAAASPGSRDARADPAEVGRWLEPFTEDGDGDGRGDFDARPPRTRAESAQLPTAVNSVVVADGRILYWGQLEGTEEVEISVAVERPRGAVRTRLLDLSSFIRSGDLPPPSGAWTVPSPQGAKRAEFTGSDQRHLPDGRVLVVGGTRWVNEDAALEGPHDVGRTELYGRASARVFDPVKRSWSVGDSMNFGRYYPSLITLPDGRLLVVGGARRLIYSGSPGDHPSADALPQNVRDVEIYDPQTGNWIVGPNRSRVALPTFARLHLLPNGKLLYPAVGMLYPPGAGDREASSWGEQRWYDPRAERWQSAGGAPFGVRSNAFSVLLPLEPPYDKARVLVGGGTVGPWPSGYLGTPLTEIIQWGREQADPLVARRVLGPPMNSGRWHSTAVALPTGEVIAFSGADRDEVVHPGSAIAVRHPDMYEPALGGWVRLAAAARDRTLHNTAVLLRDGSVLVGGHAPAPAHYGSHTSSPPGLASNFKDPSFEIFQPPYLFRGPRPEIGSISPRRASSGSCFTIRTTSATASSLRVVLSRLPATTHAVDADQRTVVLSHRPVGENKIIAEIPASGAVVPPGPYYLFLLQDNGTGHTPSVADIVTVTTRSSPTAPSC